MNILKHFTKKTAGSLSIFFLIILAADIINKFYTLQISEGIENVSLYRILNNDQILVIFFTSLFTYYSAFRTVPKFFLLIYLLITLFWIFTMINDVSHLYQSSRLYLFGVLVGSLLFLNLFFMKKVLGQ